MPRDHLHLRTLKRMVGVVVGTGMDRTAIVAIPRLRIHQRTRKIVKVVTKFFCHDQHDICGVGDKVQIKYCGQVSKKKHWTVIDMLARFPQLHGEPFPMSRLKGGYAGQQAAGGAPSAVQPPSSPLAAAAQAPLR